MESEILVAIITSTVAAIASVTCAAIANRNGKRQDESAKSAETYRKDRERLDVAKWKVLKATMEGVTVLLRQAKGEKLAGGVDDALENLQDAEQSLDDVQTKLLAKVQS